MPNKLFKKGLVVGIIILFIGIAFIPSFNAVSISKDIEETNQVGDDSEEDCFECQSNGLKYKDYKNCTITTPQGEVDGIAFLFPGFFSSGANVKRSFGILKADEPIFNHIFFNNDKYFANWSFAFIFSFDGYFLNYNDGPFRIFEIDGIAKFVRVYF